MRSDKGKRFHAWAAAALLLWVSCGYAQERTNRTVKVDAKGRRAVKEDARGRLKEFLLGSNLWTTVQADMGRRLDGLWFYWAAADKSTARSDAVGLDFLDQSAAEVLLRFASNTLSEVDISFFNRGDTGEIEAADFDRRVDAVDAALTKLTGVKGRDITPRQASSGQRKQDIRVWDKGATLYRLDAACSWRKSLDTQRRQVLPEFLNLTLVKNTGKIPGDIMGKDKVEVGVYELKNRVKKEENGDVLIDQVPMVDQGRKGYCAVAATERVMRYYGVEVNQYELAQRAQTASGGGTDPASLVRALKSMANLLGVQVHVLDNTEGRDFLQLINEYDRAAKREHKKVIVLKPQGGVISMNTVFQQMDADTFLKSRTPTSTQSDRFLRTVKERIGSGYPILWSTVVGFVAEQPELKQGRGGHMRLIIGYNPQTSEILYSDSWGAGHELKHMKLADACAITTGLFCIEPK